MSNTALLGAYGDLANSGLNFRNLLINGNFDIWQRSTSAANSGFDGGSYVSADRWRFLTHTGNVGWVDGTLTQSTDTPSADIKYSAKLVSTSAALDDILVSQTVEGVNAQVLVGKQATLSFWYKKGGALAAGKTFKYAISYLNSFNVGTNAPLNRGLTTLIQENSISSASMSSTWTKVSMTVTIPSQAANGLYVDFRVDGNDLGTTGDLLFLSQVQLEAGSIATPFERRPLGLEIDLCHRYYEVKDLRWLTAQYVASTGRFVCPLIPCKPKRLNPTVAVVGGNIYWADGAIILSATSNAGVNFTVTTNDSIFFWQTRQAGGTTPGDNKLVFMESGIVIGINAEL